MFVSLTTADKGNFLVDTHEITKITENATTLAVVVHLNNSKSYEPTESLNDIWGQQNTDGNNLNMVLVTNNATGNREIHMTHRLMMIVEESGGGSKIIPRWRKNGVVSVAENLATIIGYQGATKNLGLVSATVTRDAQNKQYLFLDHMIKEIVPSVPTNPASPAIITMKSSMDQYPVAETVAALYAAQPK